MDQLIAHRKLLKAVRKMQGQVATMKGSRFKERDEEATFSTESHIILSDIVVRDLQKVLEQETESHAKVLHVYNVEQMKVYLLQTL